MDTQASLCGQRDGAVFRKLHECFVKGKKWVEENISTLPYHLENREGSKLSPSIRVPAHLPCHIPKPSLAQRKIQHYWGSKETPDQGARADRTSHLHISEAFMKLVCSGGPLA